MDIYYDINYARLYESKEDGDAVKFVFECEHGMIKHLFIKRKIKNLIDGIQYYDLVTPYGYGGPVIYECKENRKALLLSEFEIKFTQYCATNHIVSEFIRFHPLLHNADDFKGMYNVMFDRYTVGTNLKEFDDPVISEFSKSCRKNIRQGIKKGISYKITKSPDSIGDFKKIYYSTMERDKADDYYYFSDDYFRMCLEYFKEEILLVEAIYEQKTIASGFYFVYNKIIHTHLSGTLSEFLFLSPAYILRYAAAIWGKENGYEMIHHGGGTNNSEENTLYRFKKQFGKNTEFAFYIGKKIWNENIYNKLNQIYNTKSSSFFPSYRNNK